MSVTGGWLADRALRTPEALAIEQGGERVDYAALAARASRLESALAASGVGPGDVVAGLLDNGLEGAVLLWALHARGAVLLPLNWRLATDEIVSLLEDARPALVVHAGGERGAQALAATARVAGLPAAQIDARGSLIAAGAARRREGPPEPLLHGAMALLYTSGTTGRPKGAVLGAEAFRASAVASEQLIGAAATDRWLVCMPLFHVGGLSILVRSCLAGSAAIVHAGFDPVAVDRALDHEGVTVVSLVATMLQRVLDVRGARPAPGRLRCVLLGGGPTPVPLLERALALGWPVAPTYGLTEATSQVATRAPGDRAAPLDGRLQPLPGTRVGVLDDRGDPLPAGVAGEIVVAGGTLMRGYLGQPEATARALRGGWLHTGDVGELDAAGRLRVLDRRDDLIVSGGENVYPAEVEAVLLRHPGVAEAAVVALPDARYGARPVAFWVASDPSGPEPDLAAHCRAALASFKVPVAFHRRTALPRGASGKVLRRELRSSLD